MISIRGNLFTEENLNELLDHLDRTSITPMQKNAALVFRDYINDCIELDSQIQNEVSNKISPDLISVMEVPTDETDNFFELELNIYNKDGKPIKKREELLYNEICSKKTNGFEDLLTRLEQ